MCSPARCPRCHRITWQGCGLHIEEALAGVPEAERCTCEAAAPPVGDGFRRLMGPRKRRRAVGPAGARPAEDEPRPEPREEPDDDVERFLRDVPPHHGPV